MAEKEKKNYFTRKNLIAISLVALYSFLLVFVGACLNPTGQLFSKNNPILILAGSLGFQPISFSITGYIALILVALYISVIFFMMVAIVRYAKVNSIKLTNIKIILTMILVITVSLLLSLGLGIFIQRPLTKENIGLLLAYLGEAVLISVIIFVALFLLIGAILMLVINFKNIDKDFKAFKHNEVPNFDDEEFRTDVTSNFDLKPESIEQNQTIVSSSGLQQAEFSDEVRRETKLEDREKVFPSLSKIDINYSGYSIDEIKGNDISLKELCVEFRKYLALKEKLYFDLNTIMFFISGLATGHFMILEGLSGTGKSSLPRYFAEFTNSHLQFVSVQATWRDNTNVLGYFNEFSKTYSETDFLMSLYEANYNRDQLYFFVLDEMNISRVEYYFADFLSVLEYPVNDWKIRLMHLPYDFIPPAKLTDGFIQIEDNSYFIGTANKDDSTYTITDKVYDRAITIDFDNKNESFAVDGEIQTITLSKTKFNELISSAKEEKTNLLTSDDYFKFNQIIDFIYDKFDLAIGNRILNQITDLVPVFVACGGTKEIALDFLLAQKLISKLEGRFEEYVKDALKDLLKLISKNYGKNVLVKSENLINKLIRKL